MDTLVRAQRDELAETVRLHREALDRHALGHPDHDEYLNNLAAALVHRYKITGSEGDLAEAIRLFRDTLELRLLDHPRRAESLNNLAAALINRSKLTGSEDDLNGAIRLHGEALELRPHGHPRRDRSLYNLAATLRDRYIRSGSEDDLAEAIPLFGEALELRLPGHPLRGQSLNSLATALVDRYRIIGSEGDLGEAIRLFRDALELRLLGHPRRDESLSNLACALRDQFKLTGSEDDLAGAIGLHREALQLRLLGHPCRDKSLIDLASALRDRYNRTGSEDDLAETIRLHREALELRMPSHPHRDISLNNLANALNDRYTLTGSEDDLAEMILLCRETLALRPPGHPHRVQSLNSLAIALTHWYNLTGSEDDLAETVRLCREALELRPHGHPRRDQSLNSLATALIDRYNLTSSEDDLAETIRLHREALELHMPGHPRRDQSLNSLAIALAGQYNLTGSENDLAEMIQLCREALELRLPGHTRRDESLNNLAGALLDRYRLMGSEGDLADAIQLLREALELRLLGHPRREKSLNNLAAALSDRYSRIGSEADLCEAIQLQRDALALRPPGHPRHTIASTQLARTIWLSKSSPSKADEVFQLLKEGSMDTISPLNDSLDCTHSWVVWARETHHSTLSDAYDHSIRNLRRYLTIGPTIKLQYEALIQQADFLALPVDAAAHFIENGDVGRAVEILDEGRSLLWSEMRRFREPFIQPALAGNELGAAFEATCSQLQHISTVEARYDVMSSSGRLEHAGAGSPSTSISYDVLLDQTRSLLRQYDELLGLIREIPGCEEFLRSPPFKKLREAAKEGPVIIVNCSKFGSHIVVVFADRSPSVIALEAGLYEKAVSIRKQYLDALNALTARAGNSSKAFGHKLAPIALQLWDLIVVKVVEELEMVGVPKGSRIWWCPTSTLTALPLHAAGDGMRYLVDSYISSYTPTLKALIDAREPSSQSVVMNSAEAHPRLLVVAQTINSGLESAGDELNNMRSLGPWVDVLDDSDATRQSVLQSLPDHDWVHFICHGALADSGDPFESSLHLHEDTLSLNDMIKAHMPDAKFAFLAACHTAEQSRGPSVLQDEILHLAGAMQFSGFRSVVGTMWQMEDKDGPKVAELFYAEMLKGDVDSAQRHTRAARALWQVVRRMKAKNVSMDRWVNFVHIGA